MAGISSKALAFGNPENKKNKFQNQELNNDLGVNYYEFRYRNHDYQIGRFIQIDPLAEDYEYNSTYAFSENKVIAHFELEGLESIDFRDMRRNERYGRGEITEKQFREERDAQAKAGMVGVAATAAIVGVGLAFAYPTVAAPIMASYIFGAPSPGAPTSMISTVTAEASALGNEVKVLTQEINLAARAKEVQSVLAPATQSRTTTAVASAMTSEGNSAILVASSEKNLRPAQIAALKPGEIPVSGKGHAETTILNHAQANGMTVNAVAASRPICSGCATAIQNAGAVPASPLKITPAKPAVDPPMYPIGIGVTPKL